VGQAQQRRRNQRHGRHLAHPAHQEHLGRAGGGEGDPAVGHIQDAQHHVGRQILGPAFTDQQVVDPLQALRRGQVEQGDRPDQAAGGQGEERGGQAAAHHLGHHHGHAALADGEVVIERAAEFAGLNQAPGNLNVGARRQRIGQHGHLHPSGHLHLLLQVGEFVLGLQGGAQFGDQGIQAAVLVADPLDHDVKGHGNIAQRLALTGYLPGGGRLLARRFLARLFDALQVAQNLGLGVGVQGFRQTEHLASDVALLAGALAGPRVGLAPIGPLLIPEHPHGLGHAADLVLLRPALDLDRKITTRQGIEPGNGGAEGTEGAGQIG